MLTLLSSQPISLLAEHMYIPVSSLEVFVIVKFIFTLVTFAFPVGTLILSLTDTLSLKVPLVLLHTSVGGGYPNVSHVIVIVFPSLITVLFNRLTVAIPVKCKAEKVLSFLSKFKTY